MARILNILHLSDFHQSNKTRLSESHVLGALWDDLEVLADSESAPDVCIFSGDLVYSADESGSGGYERFRSDVLDRIEQITKLTPARILICPGNHDASRTRIKKLSDTLSKIRERGFGADPSQEAEYGSEVFAEYLKFAADYYSKPDLIENPFKQEFLIPELDLTVDAVNTAVLTSAALDGLQPDFRLLRVRDSDVAGQVASSASSKRILFQHHPIGWLEASSQLAYEAPTLKNVLLHCFGHMHDAKPSSVYYGERRTTLNQSGALFYGSHRGDTYKGYALISVDRESAQARIVHRRYYNGRARFDASLDDFSNGVFFSDERAERHFDFHQPKFSRKRLNEWAKTNLLPHYVDAWAATGGIQPKEKFFEPELELRDPVAEAKRKEEDSTKIEAENLTSLRARDESILLEGAAESGKSESLRQWTRVALESPSEFTRIPVYIDWKLVNWKYQSLDAAVKRSIPRLPEGFEVVDLLRRGCIDIMIDDFVLNAESLRWIDDSIAAFSKLRFVLAQTENFRNPLDFGTIAPGGQSFLRARLKQLRPSQIRQYVKSALPLDASGEDRFISDIHREVTQNNLPLTPFTIWSIIEVYQRDKSIRFANKANFVERLIEIKLEKYASREIDASTFDFENKSHCLTELAAWMTARDQYRPTCSEVEEWMLGYVNNLGLAIRPLKLLKMFEDSGVLVRDGDRLTFSFRIYLEYFIACKMAQDREFRKNIASEENFLAYHNEMVLYFAKSRQDRELLDWVGGILDEQVAALEARGVLDPNFEASLDAMPIAGGREEKKEFETFASHMSLPQPSDEERDEVLAGEFPEDIGKRQEVYRPRLDSEESRWIFSMILYSQMIRFADFLTDQEKQIHVGRALKHWARFTHLALKLIPALIETGRMIVDGVSYDIRGLLDLPRGERLRVLQILLPLGLSRLVSYYMNSDKLRRQLKASAEGESAFLAMLRGGFLLDLGYEGVADDLERLLKLADRSKYARSVLLRRSVEAYSRFRLHDSDVLKFRKIVSDGIARHRGVTGRSLVENVNKISNALQRKRLQVLISKDEPQSDVEPSAPKAARKRKKPGKRARKKR